MVIRSEVKIPLGPGVTAKVENKSIVTIKGPKGEVTKKLLNPRLPIEVKDGEVVIKFADKTFIKADKMFMNTYVSHIKNMIIGVNEGFIYKIKVCSGHFPITVTVEKGFVVIKNFLGEKVPRKARIMDKVNVVVEGEIITISGVALEDVSQTAGRIEQATRITKRDRRIFQDGCYIIEKAGKAVV